MTGSERGRRFLFRGLLSGGEEVNDSSLDGQFDPSVDELTKPFVGGEPFGEALFGSCTNEATGLLAAVDIVQFVVRAVSLRMFFVHALTPCPSTDLILLRDASRMHGAHGLQLSLNAPDFRFNFGDRHCFHGGYHIYDSHICQHHL